MEIYNRVFWLSRESNVIFKWCLEAGKKLPFWRCQQFFCFSRGVDLNTPSGADFFIVLGKYQQPKQQRQPFPGPWLCKGKSKSVFRFEEAPGHRSKSSKPLPSVCLIHYWCIKTCIQHTKTRRCHIKLHVCLENQSSLTTRPSALTWKQWTWS